MYCRISDLRSKFVINVRNGCKLGYVSDVELDTVTATASALIIKGKLRLLGLLGRDEDIVIRWEDIEVIGEDTVLVNHTIPANQDEQPKRGRGWLHILTED